jgi:hypothetical protein
MSRPIGPGDGFRVDPDQVAVLGRTVTAVADRVQDVTHWALPVPPEAYGQVGQLFAGAAANAAGTLVITVGLLADANRDAAGDLDAVHAEYLAAEQENTARFSGIHC